MKKIAFLSQENHEKPLSMTKKFEGLKRYVSSLEKMRKHQMNHDTYLECNKSDEENDEEDELDQEIENNQNDI
jgi:hypothetical protein